MQMGPAVQVAAHIVYGLAYVIAHSLQRNKQCCSTDCDIVYTSQEALLKQEMLSRTLHTLHILHNALA